ncbi:hypothetical protein D3C80_1315100 [compost metagenome]
MGLADLLANGHYDAPPADHGAQPQGNGHGNLHPQRNVVGGAVDLLLEHLHLGLGIGIELRQLVLVDQANGFGGQVHVVTHVGHGLCGHPVERTIAFDLGADHPGQRCQRRQQFFTGLRLADERAEGLSRIRRCGLRGAALQGLLSDLGHRGELQRLVSRHGAVQGIGHGQGADQDQHDQAHAFLPVVGAMGERYPGAGEDQQPANPPGRWRVADRRLVQLAALDQHAQGQQQQRRAGKAHQRRQQQRIANLAGLGPVHATGAVAPVHQGVGDTDANDRADQRMR